MDTEFEAFKARFRFNRSRAGYVGVEREAFIVSPHLVPVSAATQVLRTLGQDARFTYELSACQVEARTSPHSTLSGLGSELMDLDTRLKEAARSCGFLIDYHEVAPAQMCLEVFPDPTGRYQRIRDTIPRTVLSAACRIIGTHVHVGMRDHESALRAYNRVIRHLPYLARWGDHSNGERMRLYRIVAPQCNPPPYTSWAAFYADACRHGYVHNPRDNWRLVRLTAHGTIEARMFGATADLHEIVNWAREFSFLCRD